MSGDPLIFDSLPGPLWDGKTTKQVEDEAPLSPGPWKFQQRDDILELEDANGIEVCCFSPNDNECIDPVGANRRLIEAAPELLRLVRKFWLGTDTLADVGRAGATIIRIEGPSK
jgi:hypothetical protein